MNRKRFKYSSIYYKYDYMTEIISRKDGIEYNRQEKRILIPSKTQYRDMLKQLAETNQMKAMVAVRLGCELGISRLEICNAEVSNIDRYHKRGLWLDIAKKIRKGNKAEFVMRKREVPVNVGLYALLNTYIQDNLKFIVQRSKGDINKPMNSLQINYLYDIAGISWSTHKSRHYFKTQVWNWMRKERQIDTALVKELMGHTKSVDENYGEIDWEYKLDVIDKVFV